MVAIICLRLVFIFILLFYVSGCYGPLDVLGVICESTYSRFKKYEPEDDKIEDKHPQYDPSAVVVEEFNGCDVKLNKSGSVTKLDILPFDKGEKHLEGRIFPGRAEAIEAITQMEGADIIPSMEVINGYMKPFNDGLYASIEIAVEDGIEGIYEGKLSFLHRLFDELVNLIGDSTGDATNYIKDAAAEVAAGMILGGESPQGPSEILSMAEQMASDFESNPRYALYAKPIGFYTWNDKLSKIFTQDRFLQHYQGGRHPYSEDEFGTYGAMAVAFNLNPDLFERYQEILAVYRGLTNPYAHYPVTALVDYFPDVDSLNDVASIKESFLNNNPPGDALYEWCYPHFALFPSSYSKETDFFNDLECHDELPTDLTLFDILISAIRNGDIDLEPAENSGWYDYQSYALETLLLPENLPESDHLLLTAAYKKKLIETFKSIMTQTRETHVKSLEIGFAGATAEKRKFKVYPKFPVEPFPTFYLRSARAYRFLETYLKAVVGEDFLESVKRLNEDGTYGEESVLAELHSMAELLYGFYILAAESVGMRPEFLDEEMAEYDVQACRDSAVSWLSGWKNNSEILKDPRVMVPVQVVNKGGVTMVAYWAVIGVKVVKAGAEFVEGYMPEIIEATVSEGGMCEFDGFVGREYFLVIENTVEVLRGYEAPPLTRDELRSICNQYTTEDEIVEALQNY